MKTPMDDMEIQNVIDLLLTKQIGTSAPVNHDWVEASEKNETKQLQRQLAEKETLLADEVAKSKSLTDRMNVLRYAIYDYGCYRVERNHNFYGKIIFFPSNQRFH